MNISIYFTLKAIVISSSIRRGFWKKKFLYILSSITFLASCLWVRCIFISVLFCLLSPIHSKHSHVIHFYFLWWNDIRQWRRIFGEFRNEGNCVHQQDIVGKTLSRQHRRKRRGGSIVIIIIIIREATADDFQQVWKDCVRNKWWCVIDHHSTMTECGGPSLIGRTLRQP